LNLESGILNAYQERIPNNQTTPARRIDWRGWIALAWILFWGAAYLRTAVAPRLAPVLARILSMIG
jgi:hypothetical protein